MKNKFLLILVAVCLVAGITETAGAYSFYTDRSAWEAQFTSYVETSEYGDAYTTLTAGTGIDVGYGESLSFAQDLDIRTLNNGWSPPWTPGYTGDVLFSGEDIYSMTGTFASALLGGFGFEAEPNVFSEFLITLTLDDGTSLGQIVDGAAGAAFFGWSLDAGDTAVTSMTITVAQGSHGFAIGRMVAAGSNPVPEPATMLLFGSGLIGLAGLGRRKFLKK